MSSFAITAIRWGLSFLVIFPYVEIISGFSRSQGGTGGGVIFAMFFMSTSAADIQGAIARTIENSTLTELDENALRLRNTIKRKERYATFFSLFHCLTSS